MGKTVTTYLIDGDPKGTRYVFIENNVCRMYVIPRTKLDILNEEKLLQGPALYILLGESEDAKPKAYIGQTESFRDRVREHDNKKDFWNKVCQTARSVPSVMMLTGRESGSWPKWMPTT